MILNGLLAFGNTAIQIGIKIPKVPHDVPVANAKPIAITKTIAGKKFIKLSALPLTTLATNSLAPKLSVIDFRVQAKIQGFFYAIHYYSYNQCRKRTHYQSNRSIAISKSLNKIQVRFAIFCEETTAINHSKNTHNN